MSVRRAPARRCPVYREERCRRCDRGRPKCEVGHISSCAAERRLLAWQRCKLFRTNAVDELAGRSHRRSPAFPPPRKRRIPARGSIHRKRVLRQLALGSAALATIVVTVGQIRPVFLGSAPVISAATHAPTQPAWLDSTLSRAPWLTLSPELAMASQQFRLDRESFALDLIRTGRMTPVRARKLADVAVREAYKQRIPPALVLGVMLTENDAFKSTARSSVGAVGLMQVYGKVWRDALGERYGRNLHDDATNLRYGIFILRYMRDQVPDSADVQSGWRRALLGYNGCVRGTNTPTCHRYPDVVRANVLRAARATCGGRDFEKCVIAPLWVAMRTDRMAPAAVLGD